MSYKNLCIFSLNGSYKKLVVTKKFSLVLLASVSESHGDQNVQYSVI